MSRSDDIDKMAAVIGKQMTGLGAVKYYFTFTDLADWMVQDEMRGKLHKMTPDQFRAVKLAAHEAVEKCFAHACRAAAEDLGMPGTPLPWHPVNAEFFVAVSEPDFALPDDQATAMTYLSVFGGGSGCNFGIRFLDNEGERETDMMFRGYIACRVQNLKGHRKSIEHNISLGAGRGVLEIKDVRQLRKGIYPDTNVPRMKKL